MKRRNSIEALPARPRRNVNWGNGIFLVIAHLAAVAALFFWSWAALITAAILYWVAGSLGIEMGFHRPDHAPRLQSAETRRIFSGDLHEKWA